MTHSRLFVSCMLVAMLLQFGLAVGAAKSVPPAGVKVKLVDPQGTATISVRATEKYSFEIDVDPRSEHRPLSIGIELPISGRDVWPIADVEVRDAQGRAMPVRRGGIEWHKLLISVAAKRDRYVVRRVDPAAPQPQSVAEKERHVTDPMTGLRATISNWYDGRRAALSIRFDDSHSTHLSKAIPILSEYGFRGTFMVNPGGHSSGGRRQSAFETHRSEWIACARRGDQELANHTLHHQGALDDESMEYEIGEASKALWKLFPDKSQLMALNLGGGSQWVTTKTLRYYLDKYHLFDASANSTGMDDTYGNRVANFRRLLERHIERGLWYKIHYHSIGEGLSASESNFRAALDIAKEHESELWIAGMADIYKYQTERKESKLTLVNSDRDHLSLKLVCLSDVELYNQPLTLEVTLPKSWPPNRVLVKNLQGKAITTRIAQDSNPTLLRFEVAPLDANYTIELATE